MEAATPLLTLEEFLETPIGKNVPPMTRLIASKRESGETPDQIARALGISIEIVNRHIKVIQCFPCRSEDEKFLEDEQQDEDLKRFTVALYRAVEPRSQIAEETSHGGEAAQRAKVLEYLNSSESLKLSAHAREQLQMWAEGASQREVGRKLGVDQGNLSRRIKAALNEAYRMESSAKRKAVPKGRPRSSDALDHATTGGKTQEGLPMDPDDLPARAVGPSGAGPDR